MRTHLIKLILVLFCFSPSLSIAEVSGKVIAYACYSCHGEKLSQLNHLQVLSAQQLNNTLLNFKYNKTESTIMDRITKGYTDNELHAVAAYLSALK